jgi:hypothetical protein
VVEQQTSNPKTVGLNPVTGSGIEKLVNNQTIKSAWAGQQTQYLLVTFIYFLSLIVAPQSKIKVRMQNAVTIGQTTNDQMPK